MRLFSLYLGLFLAAGIIYDLHEFFVTNRGVDYFSSEPWRLAYVGLFGLIGGMAAFGLSRLSSASQRSLKLLALGGFGGLLVVGTLIFGSLLCRMLMTRLVDSRLGLLIAAACCSMAVAAAFVFLDLREEWKRPK